MEGYTFATPIALRIQGKHARRYLQNRLTNDIANLHVGQHCSAAALTAQGKVEVYGVCLAESDQSFIFYSTGGDVLLSREALARYRVAEQVEFVVLEGISLHHIPERTPLLNQGSTFPVARIAEFGTDILTFEKDARPAFQPITQFDFYRRRWEHNHPLMGEEIAPDMLLSEIEIQSAISFSKGCYVGQEVIAKIDSLGKPPRILCRFDATGSHQWERGTKLQNHQGRAIGEIRSIAFDPKLDRTFGFALIKNDQTLQELLAGDVRLRIFVNDIR